MINKKISLFAVSCMFFSGILSADQRPLTRADIVVSKGVLKLASPGMKGAIPYEKFGHFSGIGTKDYKYTIDDKAGLAAATGEGIFPNNKVSQDPRFKQLLKDGKLNGNHWTFADIPDAEIAFYKWASVNEDPGVKQFYTGIMLERSGKLEEAIKAYYALIVHFPKTVSYTYYKTPWYVAPAAMDRMTQLLRRHPGINLELIGGRITIEGRYDNDSKNDSFIVDPGQLVSVKKHKKEDVVTFSKKDIVKTIGGEHSQLVKYKNNQWQFFVDGKPFPIKAITYSVTPIGASPDRGTWNPSEGWQTVDTNKNGVQDGFFESYVADSCDKPADASVKRIGDGQLLKDLGVNTLRAYHHVHNKEMFRKLYKDYGLRVIAGDLLGGYAVGSGASWAEGTDYSSATQRAKMLDSVREMVNEYKDEPYVIMWVLGNENIYGVANNSSQKPEAFFSLMNEAARMIHEMDPSRPVAMANGDLLRFDLIVKLCPDIDVMGANVYRGEQGFGRHLFTEVKDFYDKPFMVTEYGLSAIAEGYSPKEAEDFQSMYLANNWEDLESNMAGHGVGNVLGGVLFEFMDEWWKANSDLPTSVQKERGKWYDDRSAIYKNLQPDVHESVPQFGFPFLDGWSYEEWYGLTSQGEGKDSPFCRVLRPSYFQMKKMWNH